MIRRPTTSSPPASRTPSGTCAGSPSIAPGSTTSDTSRWIRPWFARRMPFGSSVIRRRRIAASAGIRWMSGPDDGMYDAVNKGLATASGDILAYLPSDDAYLPWAIETIVDRFASRPRLDLAFGDGITIEEDFGTQILRLYAPFDRISLANHASLMQPAVFWRRRLHERLGGFDARMRYVADLDYWLRAAAAGATMAHVAEVIALERVHEGRLSSARREA